MAVIPKNQPRCVMTGLLLPCKYTEHVSIEFLREERAGEEEAVLSLICVLAGSILFAIVFKKPLKLFPWAFYLLAIALNSLLLLSYWVSFSRTFQMIVLLPLQRCHIAFALFVIVMFIGVFKDGSRTRAYLLPIRAELSLMACILTVPHIIRNLATYLPRLQSDAFGVSLPVYFAVICAFVLMALLLLLGTTSFKAVRERMHTAAWKKVQSLAYAFFVIIFLHLGLMLAPSAMSGGIDAVQSIIAYGAILALYVVLRIRRALADRTKRTV